MQNYGGELLAVPGWLSETDSQRRWLSQPSFTGANPRLETITRRAWRQYCNLSGQPVRFTPVELFRFWIGKLLQFLNNSRRVWVRNLARKMETILTTRYTARCWYLYRAARHKPVALTFRSV